MSQRSGSNSRALLGRLRDTMASEAKGQERLDTITHLIADSMGTEVCSIYLFRDTDTLELCATEGLNRDAVHQTRMKLGEGLVGRVAKSNKIVNTADAPSAKGFRYMPETGEEIYSSFLGIPIQRLGEKLGVLVVQSKLVREFTSDEIYALEVVAMVIAEMTELGAFVGEETGLKALHQQAVMIRGATAQEGAAQGNVWLHEPRVVVTNLVTEDPEAEKQRLRDCVETLQAHIDTMFDTVQSGDKEQLEVLEAYKMFANSRGWMRRMETDIDSGLSAEAAVEKEQST
ncbi:MAG: GAF domain-containing protein, partial [Rhodobacteraceae bacterium]|nr:GAF domain-containing protein [Paracoccaceae bacterium]